MRSEELSQSVPVLDEAIPADWEFVIFRTPGDLKSKVDGNLMSISISSSVNSGDRDLTGDKEFL